MDKVFLDTDVAVDIISKREPFFDETIKLIAYSNEKSAELWLSEGSIYNLIYLAYDALKIENPDKVQTLLLEKCHVVKSNKQLLLNAIQSPFKDKEDACQYFTAIHNQMDHFITRNKKDYEPYKSVLPIYTPSEFLQIFNNP